MEDRRMPAGLVGSEGRRGFRERGVCRGFEEIVDLWEGLGEGEKVREERDTEEREEIWVGEILTLLGLMKRREVILGGARKMGVCRRVVVVAVERESESELKGRIGRSFWSSDGVWVSGFSLVWLLESISSG